MNTEAIQEIINSKVNGQKKQMVDQIRDYGAADFFVDLGQFINESDFLKMSLHAEIGISYHAIVSPGMLIT